MHKYLLLGLLFAVLCTCGPAPGDVTDGPITLSRDSLSLTVDPQLGGRIVSLKYGSRELLNTGSDSTGFTLGSTAWPSPQVDWKWPPPAAIDAGPYTVQRLEDHSILLISEPTEDGLVMQKRYRLGPDSDIGLTYWLTYYGDTVRSVAAWEVTRLPYGGRLEFIADSVRTDPVTQAVVDSRDSLRIIHFDERHAGTAKVFANLREVPVVLYYDGLRLEKHPVVTDFYRVAPGQAPLEVYLDPERHFIELELQGDYRRLSYGETSTLRTKWVVARTQVQ